MIAPHRGRWRPLLLGLLALGSLGASADQDAIRDEISRIDIQLMQADDQLSGATARVRELEVGLTERQAALDELDATLLERRQRLALRVRAMYRMRHRGFLPLLFSAQSAHELMRNARSLWWIVRADREALDRFSRQRAGAEAERARLAQDRSRLLERAGEVYAQREERRGELAALQARVEGSRPTERGPVRRSRVLLEAPAESVDVRMNGAAPEEPPDLPVEELAPESLFPRSQGLLPLPAVGSIERSGRGIDLLAPAGAPIRAVADGVVSRVLTIRGFGLVAILDHGGGWHTIYGHAAAFGVSAGERVQSGQLLGTVGEAGSPPGARLHFELRDGRDAQDPLQWLKVPPGISVR